MQPLVLLLDDPAGADLFTRACRMMRRGCRTFGVCVQLLRGT